MLTLHQQGRLLDADALMNTAEGFENQQPRALNEVLVASDEEEVIVNQLFTVL